MINRFVGSWIILCRGAMTHVTCQHEGKRQTAFAVPGGESGGASCAVAERDIRRPRRALVQHAWPASRPGGPGSGRASRAARRAAAGDPRASSASGEGCGVRRGTGEHGGARRSNRSLVPSGPVKSAVFVSAACVREAGARAAKGWQHFCRKVPGHNGGAHFLTSCSFRHVFWVTRKHSGPRDRHL